MLFSFLFLFGKQPVIIIIFLYLSHVEGSRSRVPEKDFQSLTVERLRALLKEKGLSRNGKKASRQNTYSHLLELLGTV